MKYTFELKLNISELIDDSSYPRYFEATIDDVNDEEARKKLLNILSENYNVKIIKAEV